jgi:hypothetical protein
MDSRTPVIGTLMGGVKIAQEWEEI